MLKEGLWGGGDWTYRREGAGPGLWGRRALRRRPVKGAEMGKSLPYWKDRKEWPCDLGNVCTGRREVLRTEEGQDRTGQRRPGPLQPRKSTSFVVAASSLQGCRQESDTVWFCSFQSPSSGVDNRLARAGVEPVTSKGAGLVQAGGAARSPDRRRIGLWDEGG